MNKKQQYEQEGFVLMEGLFTREQTQQLKDEIRTILAAGTVNGPNDFAKNGVFVGLAKRNLAFQRAAEHPELIEALTEIRDIIPVFVSDKVVAKSASTDFGSPWHQDRAYWKGKDRLSVWIALDDARVENGCLQIIRGSHTEGELVHGGDASDGLGFGSRMGNDAIDLSKAESIEVEAGSAIIFHDLLLHASHPNQSGKDRWSLVSTYEYGGEK